MNASYHLYSSSLRSFWMYSALRRFLRAVTEGFSNSRRLRSSCMSFVLLHLRLNCFRALSILSPSLTITLSIYCILLFVAYPGTAPGCYGNPPLSVEIRYRRLKPASYI